MSVFGRNDGITAFCFVLGDGKSQQVTTVRVFQYALSVKTFFFNPVCLFVFVVVVVVVVVAVVVWPVLTSSK